MTNGTQPQRQRKVAWGAVAAVAIVLLIVIVGGLFVRPWIIERFQSQQQIATTVEKPPSVEEVAEKTADLVLSKVMKQVDERLKPLADQIAKLERRINPLDDLTKRLAANEKAVEENRKTLQEVLKNSVTKAESETLKAQVRELNGTVAKLGEQVKALEKKATETSQVPPPVGGVTTEEECEMKKLIGAALAACLIAGTASAEANRTIYDSNGNRYASLEQCQKDNAGLNIKCGVSPPADDKSDVTDVEENDEWTDGDGDQMVRLIDKMMKLERTPNHQWKASQKNFLKVPPGCQEERKKVHGGTIVRVVCN